MMERNIGHSLTRSANLLPLVRVPVPGHLAKLTTEECRHWDWIDSWWQTRVHSINHQDSQTSKTCNAGPTK